MGNVGSLSGPDERLGILHLCVVMHSLMGGKRFGDDGVEDAAFQSQDAQIAKDVLNPVRHDAGRVKCT